MAKTKVTPGQSRRCPMCTYVARSDDDYKKHVLQCAMRTFNCMYCNYTSNKEINVKRHERRSHTGMTEEPIKLDGKRNTAKESTSCSSKSVEAEDVGQSEEEWLQQDYGDIIGSVSTDNGSSDEVTQVIKTEKRVVLLKISCWRVE